MSLPSVNLLVFYTSWNPRNGPDKILKLMVTMTRLTVKSRSQNDVAYLQVITNIPTKYQLPTPYGLQYTARSRFYRSRSLRQGQSSNQGHTMTLHTYNPPDLVVSLTYKILSRPYLRNCKVQEVSTSYTLWFPRYNPDKILYGKVTMARSKVKSRSHHDVAHLHPPTSVPTKHQLPTQYCFRDIAWIRFYGSRSLRQGQI